MAGTRYSRDTREGRAPMTNGPVARAKLGRLVGLARTTPVVFPGGDADKPTEIPAKGWLQIVKRGWAEAKTDQVPLLGAGVAFYAFLALFPAIIALVTLYGLFADPAVIADQVNSLSALPAEVRQLVVDQVNSRNRAALG